MPDEGLRLAFRKSLRQGSGRAMLLLRPVPSDEGLRDELLRACQLDLRFDPQCEDLRDGYLFRLIQVSRRGAFFIGALKRSLLSKTHEDAEFDCGQMFAILCRLAAETPDFDRSWLRDWLSGEEYGDVGKESLRAYVGLEGVAGLLFCVERFAAAIGENIDQENGWLLDSLVEALAARDGEDSAKVEIEAARTGHGTLDGLLQRLKSVVEAERPVEPDGPMDYAAAKAALEPRRLFPRSWVNSANAEDLERAASDLLVQRDERPLVQYLNIFVVRDFPLAPETLLPLLQNASPRVSYRAARALGRLRSDTVRGKALALISDGGDIALAVSLLWNNFQTSDWVVLEAAIDAKAPDEGTWHSLFARLSDLFAEHRASASARPILLRLYEEMPCSLCRVEVLRGLLASGGIPEAITEECQFDAEPYVVELVSSSAA